MKLYHYFIIVLLLLIDTLPSRGQNSYRNLIGIGHVSEPSSYYYYPMTKTNDGGIIFLQPLQYTANLSWALIKLDSMGVLQWAKYYDTSLPPIWPDRIISLPDGSFVLSGNKTSGLIPGFYWHVDSSGNLLTAKAIQNGLLVTGYRGAVAYLPDSNLIFTGTKIPMDGKGILYKTNIQGNVIWSLMYQISNAWGVYPLQVINTHDGGILTVGYTMEKDSVTPYHYFLHILKSDINGNLQWFRQIRDSLGHPRFISVMQSSYGDYYVSSAYTYAPTTNSLLKLDSSGQFKWNKHYSTTYFYRIHEFNDTLLIAGSFLSFQDDPALTALDTSGNLVPYFSYQSSNYNTLSYTYNTNSIDHFTNDFAFTDNHQAIIFTSIEYPNSTTYTPVIIKTDTLFHADCFTSGANIMETPASNFTIDTLATFTNIALSDSNYISWYNPITLNPLISDICLILSTETLSNNDPKFTISPNPSPGNFTIVLNHEITRGTIEIINALGQTIHSEPVINVLKKEIRLENPADGFYFVRVYDGDAMHFGKIIIEGN